MATEATYIPRTLIEETLAQTAMPGKRLLEPMKARSIEAGVPFHILEDVAVENPPEIHEHEADLWQCLEGEVTFVVGGTMLNKRLANDGSNPNEYTGDGIEDGTTYEVKQGDVLFIPAGVPHLHKTSTSARLIIVKIPKIT